MQDADCDTEIEIADRALQDLRRWNQALTDRLKLRSDTDNHVNGDTGGASTHAQQYSQPRPLDEVLQHPSAPLYAAAATHPQAACCTGSMLACPSEVNLRTNCAASSILAVPQLSPAPQQQQHQQDLPSGEESQPSVQLLEYSQAAGGMLLSCPHSSLPLTADQSSTEQSVGWNEALWCGSSSQLQSTEALQTAKPAAAAAAAAAATTKRASAWKLQVLQEKELLHSQQKQAAAQAAVQAKQEVARRQAASWQAKQHHLPFHVQHNQAPSTATHKLQKSLSMIPRSAAAGQQDSMITWADSSECSPSGRRAGSLLQSQAACLPEYPPPTGGSSSSRPVVSLKHQPQAAVSKSADWDDRRKQGASCCSASKRCVDPRTVKQQAWAAADAVTDAQVDSYLLDHWQQQHLETAAVVLQCGWRSRVARLAFNRYLRKRQASIRASLQPAFMQWAHWTRACAHSRRHQQQAALLAWRELLDLQLQLCSKVLKALQRGVLSGDMPALVMWRLCTSSTQQLTAVRPSMGGMLASILLQRAPRMQQKECWAAWRRLCQSQSAVRARVYKLLCRVVLSWRKQRLQQGIRFWRMYTACSICERLQLRLPAFPQPCDAFDAWLWKHQRRRQLVKQAAGLAGRLGVLPCFVNWQRHVHKMLVMRAAWSGLLLHTQEELVQGGMSAFKANWREQHMHTRLLAAALFNWKDVVDRSKAVAALRKRIQQVAEARCKAAGLSAFQRYCRMSRLLSAAAVLRRWQVRPLVLAHIHAWLQDTLHATFYLCWWRWKRRAVARMRWRAALGLHMYRAHWLHLELVFCGWRKLTAAAERQHLNPAEPAAGHAGPIDTAANDPACTTTASTQLQPAQGNGILNSQAGQQPGALDTCGGCQEPAELSPDDAAAGCPSESSNEDDCCAFSALPDGPTVATSLADYPAGHPWRPLLLRKAVMAQQGLRRLTGLRLGRAVRDLRELEGSYIVKDNDNGAGGLLSSRVFARPAVSPGLKAMVTAQLPMNVLWRTSFPADTFWWQRVVGLLQHQVPHPDSWTALISTPQDMHSSSRQLEGTSAQDLQDLLDPSNSTCTYNCTCSRCRVPGTSQAAVAAEVAVKPAADAAASMARARLRLRAGLKPEPLQLPDGSPAPSTAAASPAASSMAPAAAAVAPSGCPPAVCSTAVAGARPDSGQAQGLGIAEPQGTASTCAGATSATGHSRRDGVSPDSNSSSASSRGASWPVVWRCEDVSWLCRVVQAEELLETAAHLLLGIGVDSSMEFYDKLQQMARGQDLVLQGDLLTWLLSGALAQDTNHSRLVLARARARDELLVATMELRERAMALHLHIPHKFTLNANRPCFDARTIWAAIITKVEEERDWEGSSADEAEADPREHLWTSLLAQHPQQQQQQQQPHSPGQPAAPNSPYHSHAAQPLVRSPLQQLVQGTEQQGNGLQPTGPGGAQTAVMALAQAAAGQRLRTPGAAARDMAPGIMLAQSAAAAGEVLRSEQASRSHTPDASQQQQQAIQQQLDTAAAAAQQQHHQQQQEAKQKQQRNNKKAMAAAQGLFGRNKGAIVNSVSGSSAGSRLHVPRLGAAAPTLTGTAVPADGSKLEDEEIFSGPDFLPIPRMTGAKGLPPAAPGRAKNNTTGLPKLSSHGSSTRQHMQQPATSDTPKSNSGAKLLASSSGSSSCGRDLLDSQGHGGDAAACTPPAVTSAEELLLKEELQGVLAELLVPAGGSLSGAPQGSDGAAQALHRDMLQGARSAAEALAGACAEWILQPAQQQQQRLTTYWPESTAGGMLQQDTMLPLPAKPHRAPGRAQTQTRGGADSQAAALSGRGSLLHSPRLRAASAPASAVPASGLCPRAVPDRQVAGVNTAATAATPADFGHDAAEEDSQQASWAALALAQGLLTPADAELYGMPNRLTDSNSSCSSTQDMPPGSDSSAAGPPTGQEASCCSSLPSIPSVQQFWAAQQQQKKTTRPHGTKTGSRSAQSAAPAPAAAAGSAASGHAPPGGRLLPRITATGQHSDQQEAEPGRQTSKQPPMQKQEDRPPGVSPYTVGCLPEVLDMPRGTQQPQQQQQLLQQWPQQQLDGRVSWQMAPVVCVVAHPVFVSCPPARFTNINCHQLLPMMSEALQALQGYQQQELCGTLQPPDCMQQGLGVFEPSQLQLQLKWLQRAAQQSVAAQQQQQQQGIPVLPWDGELLPPDASTGSPAPSGAADTSRGSAGAVLSQLLTASLSIRMAFWRQVAVQQEQLQTSQQLQGGFAWMADSSSTFLARQLHQLAWLSILSYGPQQQQRQQQQQRPSLAHQPQPLAPLREKLHMYLSAHMQWRQQQQYAPPLAPAEKWVTLEHVEQVLEFMTSLTIAVHEQLLRKRRGLTAHREGQGGPPFGSSTGRCGNSSATTAAASVQAPAAAAQVAADMTASGNRVDLSQARRAAPTVPRQRPTRPMPVYVVPRPMQQPQPCPQQYKVPLDRLEPLQGWHTNSEAQSGDVTLTSARSPRQPQAPSAAAAAQLDVTVLSPVEPGFHPALQRCASSVQSSESSWAG